MDNFGFSLFSKIKRTVIGILLLDQEITWLVLFVRKGDKLGQFGCFLFVLLSEVDSVTINDDVLAEIFIGTKTCGMSRRWLVDGPVVEWWVHHWVVGFCLN